MKFLADMCYDFPTNLMTFVVASYHINYGMTIHHFNEHSVRTFSAMGEFRDTETNKLGTKIAIFKNFVSKRRGHSPYRSI